jgi:short-subunit dehydrogenase
VQAQTVLITGASKGIGLTIAEHLHAQGHTVYGTSRAATTREGSSQHVFKMLPLDVTNDESVRACVSRVLAESGKIDVLVNNAGYDLYGAAEETSLEETLAQLETNFVGTVRMTKAVLPGMRERKHGKIVQLSSIGGMLALPNNSAYAASKFALEGYSEALRTRCDHSTCSCRWCNPAMSKPKLWTLPSKRLPSHIPLMPRNAPALCKKCARLDAPQAFQKRPWLE